MKSFVFSSTLLFCIAFSASTVSAASCQRNASVFVEVVNDVQPAQYDFTQNTLTLGRIGRGAYSPYGEGHKTYFRGLTVGRQSFRYEIRIEEQNTHANMTCLYVSRIRVLMQYQPTVYVSNEFREGSPIFNRVLAHEQTHVGITTDVLNEFAPRFKDHLRAARIGREVFGPYRHDEQASAKAELNRRVKATIAELHQQMQLKSQLRHNQYDDAELQEGLSYNREIAERLEEIFKLNN